VEVKPRDFRFYETAAGRVPCRDWLDGIEENNKILYGLLMNRLDRVEEGNFGDCDPVGEGVWELRIDDGPGYRIYFGEDGELVILLLGDIKGTKKRQAKNIKQAKASWKDYRA
jgi:putative addiction module killer protein